MSVVAIDVGGTTLKGALVAGSGALARRVDRPTPTGPAAVLGAVCALARELAVPGVIAAGVVAPGWVDAAAGVVRYAANLGWRDVPLRAAVAGELGVPVAIEHDMRAAALAEAADTPGDCLFVGLGTGISAGIIRGGRARAGAIGAAGELGHVPVRQPGERCACGQRGCLERYASAAAIGRRYAAAGGTGGAEAVVAHLGDDPRAAAVWADAVDALAAALLIGTLVLDPAEIVLGGGLAGAGAALLDPVAGRLGALLAWRPPPPVRLSALGGDAGWRGAALLAGRAR
ncbi:sugar kinase [Pilimelia anulata]|uniref:Sugar kinase n=1 Tax=Pilimelia anulata TaxID=53371 RepID=A0A8J3B4A0_9ACTN|nr:ROK family protein [Pilimelia anulata]GGJ94687.1 sugar kinase [Pilimelia anulata]